jgi:hypothetical protein
MTVVWVFNFGRTILSQSVVVVIRSRFETQLANLCESKLPKGLYGP